MAFQRRSLLCHFWRLLHISATFHISPALVSRLLIKRTKRMQIYLWQAYDSYLFSFGWYQRFWIANHVCSIAFIFQTFRFANVKMQTSKNVKNFNTNVSTFTRHRINGNSFACALRGSFACHTVRCRWPKVAENNGKDINIDIETKI